MIIEEHTLEAVAKLARLELSAEEKKKFLRQLNQVLEAFRELEQVDVKGIEPSFQPLEIKNVVRSDQASRWEWEPLSNVVPELRQEGYLKGPRVFE